MTTNQRQDNGFKHCSNCYLTVKDKIYTQYTDCGTQELLQELKRQDKDVIMRKIDKCFYRIYIYNNEDIR